MRKIYLTDKEDTKTTSFWVDTEGDIFAQKKDAAMLGIQAQIITYGMFTGTPEAWKKDVLIRFHSCITLGIRNTRVGLFLKTGRSLYNSDGEHNGEYSLWINRKFKECEEELRRHIDPRSTQFDKWLAKKIRSNKNF